MLLLTGFEPFTTGQGLTLKHNPTADIARRLGAALPDVTGAVLPVSYAETRVALTRLWDVQRPRRWIGLGYAPHRRQVEVETVALNVEHAARGDNDGVTPTDRAIVEDGPLAYRSRVNTVDAAALWGAHGVSAVPGFHAGTFLCNQVFYLGCHRVETVGDLESALFIHVPPMDDFTAFEAGLADLIDALTRGALVPVSSGRPPAEIG